MRRLVATLLVLALASAGCLTVSDDGPRAPAAENPGPGAPPADGPGDPAPRVTVVGPWQITATPGEVVGAPGDLARVRIDVERIGNAPRGSVNPMPWTRWADALPEQAPMAREIPEAGATWEAEVLVGPTPHLAFAMWWEDPSGPERWPTRTVNVSSVFVEDGRAVPTEARRDYVAESHGLQASAGAGSLVATFTEGSFADIDCDAYAGAEGPFRLVERDGLRTLVGFVSSGQSDACSSPAEAHSPRVVARADDLEAGPVRVVVYVHRTCFCLPMAWHTFEATATVT